MQFFQTRSNHFSWLKHTHRTCLQVKQSKKHISFNSKLINISIKDYWCTVEKQTYSCIAATNVGFGVLKGLYFFNGKSTIFLIWQRISVFSKREFLTVNFVRTAEIAHAFRAGCNYCLQRKQKTSFTTETFFRSGMSRKLYVVIVGVSAAFSRQTSHL